MTSQHLSHLVWSRHSLKVFLAVILTVLVSQGHGFKLYHGYYNSLFRPVVEQSFKAKVETLGAILKRHVQQLRSTENRQVDLVFLVDSSASVGSVDFQEEIKFVRKLLADFTVDLNTTRVAVITFSSREKVVRQVDHLTRPGRDKHKCSLLVEEIPRIKYVGGGTFTLGAFLEAKKVLKAARPDAQKAVFLITDGFSNGGDPRPEARRLKQEGVKIFTFGIRNGNVRELWEMASEPRNETCYVLDSFEEFEALARRALHSDLHSGTFMPQPPKKCSRLCINGGFCCHSNASCTCGTHTGKYECLCKPGYYGNGLGKDGCKPCPSGTYKNHTGSGDVSVCTPCPDENQETLPGATLVHECKCKRGFRNFNSTECTVFRCPDLKEPKHGYFVNNQCNNVFNAACGLRCRPGYELRGSSLRICQEDGSWSGQDTECVLKTCPALPAPKNGHMVCTTDDFRYPTVCRFTCQAGYQLLGSRKRSCLAIAFWTGIAARCREITCPPLPEIRDGLITPAACSEGEVPFGTTCQLSCLLGYKLHGPPAKQCTPDGTWSAISNEPSQCIDQTPPFMQCPDNIEVGADEDNDTTEVTWPVPVAVDNSGFIPVLTSDPAVVPPERFPIGITIVTYRAEDLSQNVAKCKFYVLVIDEVPPRVDKCFSPDPVVSSGDYSNVTWEEPIFSDNSGRVDVQASHSPGLFPQGHTTVVYTAFDRNGNNNTCTLDIVVSPHSCQYPDPPVNGERTCRESEEGVHCVLSCKPGHAFVKAPPPEYFCAYDNVWTPEDQMPFPDCASQSISNEVLQPASITLSGDLSCAEHKFLNRVEQNIEAKVNDKVSTLCEDNVICDIAEIQTSCEEHDEDFNKINLVANLKRRRRSVNRHGQWTRRASLKFDFTLEGTVNTTGEPKEDAMQQQEELSQSMKRLLSALQTQAKEGQFDMYVGGRWLRFSDMDFDVRRHTFSCEEGTVLMNNTCVSCPLGMFYNVVLRECRSCPVGTYQPREGQVACLVCPEKTSTSTEHARSDADCRAQCLPGSISPTGLERCETCEEGSYQPKYAQTTCLPCPDGSTTLRRGARTEDQCRERCKPGHVSRTGLAPCYPCPPGTYQPDEAQIACIKCPHDSKTNSSAANSIGECQVELDLQSDDAGAYQNQQQQLLLQASACFSNPCRNGATCETKENGLFDCKCAPGFEGVFCQQETDQCQAKPCLNGGTCSPLPGTYRCDCPDGFKEVDAHYQLDFPVASTVDFAQMPIDRPLTALTVSFWMKSDDIDNFGTPFSYAVGENDNTLTLTDYNGFVFYVNQENVVTDIPTNDGLWHHVVLTWSSVRGSWKIYVDGLLNDSGFDLSTARPVPGKGVLVIGQEQDSMGGGFTASESFVGSITQFNIWDEELSLTTIENMRTSCGDFHGNVVAWPDVQAALRGSLSPQPSTFCQDCTVPIPHEHGSADYDSLRPGSKVTFSCKRGFYVAGRDTSMCLVTGEWENETPPCLRVECGRPGTILNGYYEGWKFSFDNRVRFRCNEGYKLKGPDTLYCNEDGVWDGERPDCVEITCDLPLLSENTVHKNPQDKYLPGYTATLACAPGHKLLTAHDSVSCQSDGTWDRSVPTCDPQKCGTPPFIDNGEPDTAREEYSVGDIVRYICDYGFKLNDAGPNPKGAISCLPTGKWESILPECVIKRCQEPPLVPYATIDGTERTFLSRVTYECQPGYVLDGSGAIECLEDEQWDPEPPSCEPVDCGAPPELPNGFVTGSVFSYNSIVTCGCQPGYKLVGSMRRRCTEDGVWEGEDPVCKPVSCGRLTAPQNGRVIAPVITFQAEATYECNEGYNLQCEIVSCPPAIDIEHGSYKAPPAYTFGARLVYSCQQGYVLRGKADMECESTGFWSNEVPACDPVQCPDPDSPDHGTASALGLIYTSKVEYTCDSDYRLDGPDVRTCEADGAWSGEEPVCVLLACEPPPPIDNGRYDFKDLKVGSIVRYTCDPGHKLQGEEVRRCLSSLVLDGEEPQCIAVKCPAPEAPAYGDVTLSDVTLIVGTVATYDCDLGYLLKGETERTCGEDGSFSGAVPACDPVECTKPAEIISNGRMLGTSFTFNSTISYVCDEGYRMVGAERRVCQASGKWDQPIPVCLIVECPRATIVNGYASTFRREFGTEVSFTCRTGYRLEGPQQRTCMADGTWSGDDTICVKIICPPPPPLENGSSRNFNETTAVYSCNLGFRLTGPDSSRCDDNGLWDPAPPTCEMITCEDLSGTTLENGRIIFTSTLYGTYVRYECNLGYNLMGASERVCTASGKWEGTAPVCERIACPDFRPFLNGTIVGDGRRYGDGVIFICHSGFELQGQQDLSCQMDGTWNADQPECVNVNCGDPPVLDHATPDVINGTLYPAIITYNCDTGYEARGSGISTCQADKSWSVPELTCERVNCGDPPVLDHATPDLVNGTLYSAIITYICDFGYKARGSGISTCQADKSWSETELTCERVNCGDPPVLDHATPDLVNGTLYSAIITYICDFGYKARGSGISTCQADKSWSETELTCERVNCGDPPVLDHATPDLVNGTLYSATITYICDFGYKARGSGISTCQADKSWSETELTCDLVSCPKIPARNLPNGEVEGDNFTVGGVIRFTCNIGYRLQGVSSCTCRLDGTWSSPVPSCIVVECSDPLPLVQGSVSVRGYKYNHTATYECDTGYQLDGQSVARCTETGEWSESDRTCKLVTCQAPADVIPNGRLLNPKTSYEYRDLAEYECDAGYEEVGASAIICTADGTFSPVPPTCAKIQCPKPETPSLGYVDVENDTLVYYCLEGFELVGQQRRRCLETGQWEGVAPVCVPILCPLPAPFADGSLQGNEYTFGSSLTYTCNEGYTLAGEETPERETTRKCLATRQWSGEEPVCEPVDCGAPRSIEFGTMMGESYLYNDTVLYDCEYGYSLIGPHERTCQANGEWSGDEPYCYEILCEYPPEVANATYDPGDYDGSFFVGALVFYMCKPGHVMISSSAVMCESNGMWSEPLPECPPVVCPKLLAPENGDVTGDDITYKGQLRFSCHDGYRLSGAGDTLTCTEAGTWDLEVPTCELLTCPDPYFEHGVTRLQDQEDDDPPPTTFLPGHYVRFQCEPGYRLAGPLTARCNATGQWSISAFPVCRPITCDKPIEISHAGVSGGPVYYAGDTATYTCIEGYDIEGTATITCGADGLWVGGQPKCVDMTCPGPPSVPNAQADWDGDTVSAGEHVQYECDEGFTLDLGHDGRLLCLKGGNWSADAPSCVRVECGPPPEVDNSHLYFGSVYYSGETVTYTCYLGYELEGTATLTCGVNGTWEGESPTCVDVICDDPPYLENAYMVETGEGEETAAGGWVQYECDEGFVMDAGHDGRVSCLRGGQWSTDIPQCVPVECGQPPEVEHAKFLFQAPVYVGDLVTYTCDVGYEVDDTATLECGEDGSWVGETPRCVDVTCDSAPYIEHGFEVPGTSTETPAGKWIEYECELGFRIDPDHDGRVYCLKGGEWTSDLPTCIPVVCEAPPAVEHANFIANAEYSYGDVVTYFCQSGYELEAAATITCSWNGSWTGETPRCVDVICDTPPSIDHGRVTGAPALTSAGKFIQYECDEGFTLDAGHDGRVLCVRGGEWSADLPSCVPVECTAPPEIPEALYTESGPYQAGDIVTYVCNEGFDLEDAATLMCGTDGLWMGQTPRCVRITCTNPPYIEHGRVVGTAPGAHTPAGQWVQYECDEGFQLGDSHDGRLSCLRGGSWGTDVPVCIHVDCGPPPVPFHASVTTTGSSAGSIAFVTCNVGYRLPSGQREMQVVCDVSGTWAGSDDVRCLARDCGSPPTVRHSQPLSDVDTTYDNRVTYRCNHGYEISGEPTLRCSESGRWEVETVGSPLPTCAPVTCGPPETDMQIVGSDFTLGGVVTLACPDGWRLIGPEQITCTADRVWSPSPGHCEKITCRALEVPENAYIFSGSGEAGAETGSRVELLCDEGFLLAGDPVVTCMPDGNWTSPLPSCELLRDASAVCEETVEAENALPPPARFLPGDSAVLSCRPGYRPEGDMTSLCKGDRTWTLPSGSCVRVSCGPPPVEDAGTVKVFGNSFLFGDTVMYMCRPGLAPACLPPRLTCTETGQWDAQCKRPCQNGGRCVAFNRCKCRPGYTGAQCQLPICILPCLNGGTCQAPYSCKCPTGYYGSRCHK
ncbi:hypothetical protein BaRGS_00007651, partial [Batillaria attramentaria]